MSNIFGIYEDWQIERQRRQVEKEEERLDRANMVLMSQLKRKLRHCHTPGQVAVIGLEIQRLEEDRIDQSQKVLDRMYQTMQIQALNLTGMTSTTALGFER